ncbi:DUF2335 domain-containing protein [Desulforamulus ruminis]|uniref:DUF2335 domain-containing protein n=1 Tax=Desulforamulus ruminis TaxID=1564 RepID=UPI0023560C61|nr:DUF2335 domain-containing protein [Desulforamulus ruminis]
MSAKSAKRKTVSPTPVTPLPQDSQAKQQSRNAKLTIAAQESFSGPIPPPEVFRRYGEVVSDAPERILRVFELESEHTRNMQRICLEAEIARDKRAQWMAFAVMSAALGVTIFAIRYGDIPTGIISALATLFFALRVLFIKKDTNESNNNETDES